MLVFHGYFDGKKDIDSLKKVSNLPKIKDLTIFHYGGYKNYIDENGNVVLQLSERKIMWIRYDNFWEVLSNKYLLEYSVIISLFEYLIFMIYKVKVKTFFSINIGDVEIYNIELYIKNNF